MGKEKAKQMLREIEEMTEKGRGLPLKKLKKGSFNLMAFLVGTGVGRVILGLIILSMGAFFVTFLKSILVQILSNAGSNSTELIAEYTKYTEWTGVGFMIGGASIVLKGLYDVFRGD